MKTILITAFILFLNKNLYAESLIPIDHEDLKDAQDVLNSTSNSEIENFSIPDTKLKMRQIDLEGNLPEKPKMSPWEFARKMLEDENEDEMKKQLEKDRMAVEIERNKLIKKSFLKKVIEPIPPKAKQGNGLVTEFEENAIDIDEEPIEPETPVTVKNPPQVVKKVVDIKLLQLSCNEFTGRLSREAFPLCNIKIADIKYSKIDLTMNEEGRISSFDNSLNLAETKKLCLSGYVANRPAMSVGADFTCRVLIQ